jgi:hypothetical protein
MPLAAIGHIGSSNLPAMYFQNGFVAVGGLMS